jgi:hypothetical protein
MKGQIISDQSKQNAENLGFHSEQFGVSLG